MTLEEVYIACGKRKGMVPVTDGQKSGWITTIKDNGRHKGVAVQWPNVPYDTWYHESEETDRRTKYMRDLKLV